jgi:sugar phosphate isomerase/epimerase
MAASAPIGIQLYSVRELLKQDFAGIIRRIAEIGYVSVEPFGTPDNFQEAARLFKTLGLQVPSAHVPMPLGQDQGKVLEIAEAYGLETIVSGRGPDYFETVDGIRRTCEEFNEAGRFAAQHGFKFGVHNHWWEYLPVEGRYGYQYMKELVDPAITFQLDTYWIKVGGPDPARIVAEMGARAPLLHIKDGPAVREEPMTAVGDGVLDIPAIVKAGAGHTQWLTVEIDRVATDMMEAVERSYKYLVGEGLARGNR